MLRDCTSDGNGGHGILTGDAADISRCQVTGSSGDGIQSGNYAVVDSSVARANQGHGVHLADAVYLSNTRSILSTGNGFELGISATVRDSDAHNNDGTEIRLRAQGQVRGCRFRQNAVGIDIRNAHRCFFDECDVSSNSKFVEYDVGSETTNHMMIRSQIRSNRDQDLPGIADDAFYIYRQSTFTEATGTSAADGDGVRTQVWDQ